MKPELKRKLMWAGGAAAAVLFVSALIWGPWIIEGHHLRDKQGELTSSAGIIVTGFRTMLVAIAAGAIAGVGLWYTHKSHRQTEKLFEHTREKDREQAELTREGQVTERYVEAIKLLGSANLTERLGGIYALGRIMRDSEKDRATCIEVLCAFVRTEKPWRDRHGSEEASEDVKAAMAVLLERPAPDDEPYLNLRGANLAGVQMMLGAIYQADLSRANLAGVDFYHADLEEANLEEANLSEVNLIETNLAHVSLARANLTDAYMVDLDLSGVNLTGANLDGANLAGANLEKCLNLTQEQLKQAIITPETKLPSNLREE
ncbi:pentapeptide repeat-containing protein [Actinomycetota bacterium Odt1-20B]